MRNHLVLAVLIAIGIVIMPTHFAFAYIDPGSGSYIIQIIIGSVLAGSYIVSSSWKGFVAKARQLFSTKDKNLPSSHEKK